MDNDTLLRKLVESQANEIRLLKENTSLKEENIKRLKEENELRKELEGLRALLSNGAAKLSESAITSPIHTVTSAALSEQKVTVDSAIGKSQILPRSKGSPGPTEIHTSHPCQSKHTSTVGVPRTDTPKAPASVSPAKPINSSIQKQSGAPRGCVTGTIKTDATRAELDKGRAGDSTTRRTDAKAWGSPPLYPASSSQGRKRDLQDVIEVCCTETSSASSKKRKLSVKPYIELDPPDPNWVISESKPAISEALYLRGKELDLFGDSADELTDLESDSDEEEFVTDSELFDDDPSWAAVVARELGSDYKPGDGDNNNFASQAKNSPERIAGICHPLEKTTIKDGSSRQIEVVEKSTGNRLGQGGGREPLGSSRGEASLVQRKPLDGSKRSDAKGNHSVRSLAKSQLKDKAKAQARTPTNKRIDIQTKIGHSVLSRDEAHRRLSVIPRYTIALEPPIRNVLVSRAFITSQYGGNPQAFAGVAKKSPRGYEFMFPTLDQNPHAPTEPGQGGLLYRATDNAEWSTKQNQKVFVRLQDKPTPLYGYQGDYKLVLSEPLSKEHFLKLGENSKQLWIKAIQTRDKNRKLRARITLRRQRGRDPSEDDVREALSYTDVEGKRDRFDLDIQDIRRAFERGDEKICVWTMQCITYDKRFQEELAEKFPGWLKDNSKH